MDFNLSKIGYKSTEELIQSAKEGIEVYTGDNIRELEFNVLQDNKARRGKLVEVQDCNFYPFCVMAVDGTKQYFAYVYPIPENPNTTRLLRPEETPVPGPLIYEEPRRTPVSVKHIPYHDIDEMLKDVISKVHANHSAMVMPLIWIRHIDSGNALLVTGYLKNGVFADNFYSFEELCEKFRYLDGTPCCYAVEEKRGEPNERLS